jgi:LCP family protein required for cell wall assembly
VWLLRRTENLLVMGVDHRTGDPDPAWRTDTIMVVAIDRKTSEIGVVNIPRDLWVNIPGYGMGRINQADYWGESKKYPGGGPALLRRVITETLGIPTEHYVRIQMDGLVRLVDALGGVTVTLDCPLYERTPDDKSPTGVKDWSLPAGQVRLNGEDAKKFATYRYITSDFGRTRRQQQLIWAIRARALQLDVIPRIPELWKALADTFTTDLGLLDVIKLARLGATLQPDKAHGLVLGTDVIEPYITGGGAYVLLIKDKAKLKERLGKLFDGPPLAEMGKSKPGECPPPPAGAPTLTPTPTLEVTPTPG